MLATTDPGVFAGFVPKILRRSWIPLAAAVCACVAVSASVAGELAYTCIVTKVYDLQDDGTLETSAWDEGLAGSLFSVSRVTGEAVGEVVPTLMATSVRVVNPGSHEHSFKAVSEYAGPHVQVIEVQEFLEGEPKPFIALSMGGAGVVTGLCK